MIITGGSTQHPVLRRSEVHRSLTMVAGLQLARISSRNPRKAKAQAPESGVKVQRLRSVSNQRSQQSQLNMLVNKHCTNSHPQRFRKP
jgi:hypothetical protein